METIKTTAVQRLRFWPCLLAVVILAVVSVLARKHLIETRPLAGRLDGQEPEAHILVTELAFQQVPWRTHHFLPIFTLGPAYNKHLDQHPGAASPDAEGNYYYTSTPPLTFVEPYLASLLAGGPSLSTLRWYNITLQVMAAAALGFLVYRCGARPGVSETHRRCIALTTVAIYMAAPECLKSHSLNLWGQQFYCWLLPAQIYLLLFRPNLALLVLSTFVACLGDWTPYVASTGMAGLGLYSYGRTRDRQALRIALALLAGCAAAGLTMVAWFHTRMSFADYFANLAMRSSARADGPVLGLLPTYLNSFGLFAVFAFLVLAWRPWRAGLRQAVPRRQVILPGVDPLVIAAAIYAIALLENVLMKGHALRYSYDRLKGVQLLAILVAWAVLESPRRANLALRLALLLGLASIALFWFSFDTPRGWSYIAHSQQERLGAIMAQTSSPEGPAFFNWEVRGAEVYYAGRNIFQIAEEAASRANTDLPTFAADWSRDHGFREGTVYQISGHYPQPFPEELPRELKVTRVFASAPPIVIGTFRLRETWQDYHPARNFYGLDPIWK